MHHRCGEWTFPIRECWECRAFWLPLFLDLTLQRSVSLIVTILDFNSWDMLQKNVWGFSQRNSGKQSLAVLPSSKGTWRFSPKKSVQNGQGMTGLFNLSLGLVLYDPMRSLFHGRLKWFSQMKPGPWAPGPLKPQISPLLKYRWF